MSEDELTFTQQETGSKGEYAARKPGFDEPARVTYSRLNETTIIVDHTEVPDALRGQGVAQALVRHVVSEARRTSTKLVPLCPFFKSQIDRHPDFADVVA